MSETFTHDADAKRYTMRIDDELIAAVDYVVNGDSISFNHTFTSPKHRGHGYAAQIVEFAVNDVEATSTRAIVPMCWYVDSWFEKHPERSALLTSRA